MVLFLHNEPYVDFGRGNQNLYNIIHLTPPKTSPTMPKPLTKKQRLLNTPPRAELDLKLCPSNITRPTNDTSIIAWIHWYLTQEVFGTGKSAHTEAAARQELKKFVNYFYRRFPDGNYHNWTRQVTQDFINTLRSAQYSLNSIRQTITHVKAFSNYMSSIGMVNFESHPTRGLKPLRPDKDADEEAPQSLRIISASGEIIEEGEPVYTRMLEAAIAATKTPPKRPSTLPYRDLAILTTLYYTGLRAHEICSLDIHHMRRADNQKGIWFSRIKRKGNQNLTGSAYLKSDGVPYLDNYLSIERTAIIARYPNASTHVFLRYRGTQMTRQDIWDIIRRLAEAALTPEMRKKGYRILAHPHSLRHEITYALIRAGKREPEIAQHLAQKSTRYILRYSRRSHKLIEDMMENAKLAQYTKGGT